MSDYAGPVTMVALRYGRTVWIRGAADELAGIFGDVGGPVFVEVTDVGGETFFVRRGEVQIVCPAQLMPLADLRAPTGKPS